MEQLTALSGKRLGVTPDRKQFLCGNENFPLTVNEITQKKHPICKPKISYPLCTGEYKLGCKKEYYSVS